MKLTSPYTRALTRRPGRSLQAGLSTAGLGIPDVDLALRQHDRYVAALSDCGLDVTVLPADEDYPDAVFVEDTAVIAGGLAVICRPGAPSRRGEEERIAEWLEPIFQNVVRISSPGSLEGGDVMRVGRGFYVGLSGRSDERGIAQFREAVARFDFEVIPVELERLLHLKTGVSYLEGGALLVASELVDHALWRGFEQIVVPAEEAYAANCVCINDRVLVPSGYPRTRHLLETAGYQTVELDVSEFRKLDGGLSCLSIRF